MYSRRRWLGYHVVSWIALERGKDIWKWEKVESEGPCLNWEKETDMIVHHIWLHRIQEVMLITQGNLIKITYRKTYSIHIRWIYSRIADSSRIKHKKLAHRLLSQQVYGQKPWGSKLRQKGVACNVVECIKRLYDDRSFVWSAEMR